MRSSLLSGPFSKERAELALLARKSLPVYAQAIEQHRRENSDVLDTALSTIKSMVECAAISGVRNITIDMMHHVAAADHSSQIHTQTMRITMDDMQVPCSASRRYEARHLRRHNGPSSVSPGLDSTQHYQYVTFQDIMTFNWDAVEVFPTSTASLDAPHSSYIISLVSAKALLDIFSDRRLLEHLLWELEARGLKPSHSLECPSHDEHIRGSGLIDRSTTWGTHHGRVIEAFFRLDLWQHDAVPEQARRMKSIAPLVSSAGTLSAWGKSLKGI